MADKILIVDDEQGILTLLERAFRSAGFEPFCANSGQEALEILAANRINIMFLDLQMPEMNGVELCKRIRERNPISYIVAITGYTSLFELSDCRDVGFDDYFMKPFEIKELVQVARDAAEKVQRWTSKIKR